jgi:hypothetical protein
MRVSSNDYYVYIITNKIKTVLYTSVTNDLPQRIIEHYLNRGKPETFAGKYNFYLLPSLCHSACWPLYAFRIEVLCGAFTQNLFGMQ